MIAQFDRRRLHAAAGGQVRAGRQRQGLADDHGPVGLRLRGAVRHHVPHHPRAHPARPQAEDLRPAGLQRSAQERALDRDVHPHPGALHRRWPCAAARSSTTSSTTSTKTACSTSCRAWASRPLADGTADVGIGYYLLNTFGLVVDSEPVERRLGRLQPVQHVAASSSPSSA